jgi:hypothetical protein
MEYVWFGGMGVGVGDIFHRRHPIVSNRESAGEVERNVLYPLLEIEIERERVRKRGKEKIRRVSEKQIYIIDHIM